MWLMIGYFFAGSRFVGVIHQAVEIGLAVARLDRDRHRRLPAGGDQRVMSAFSSVQHQLAGRRRAAPTIGGTSGFE